MVLMEAQDEKADENAQGKFRLRAEWYRGHVAKQARPGKCCGRGEMSLVGDVMEALGTGLRGYAVRGVRMETLHQQHRHEHSEEYPCCQPASMVHPSRHFLIAATYLKTDAKLIKKATS